MQDPNCKNCGHAIHEDDHYCSNCRAKIVRDRLTFKTVIRESLARALGWDNKYLVTFKALLIRPQEVLSGYLEGVRKRYVNPLAFFAIGVTISLIVYNILGEDFVSILVGGEVDIEAIETQQASGIFGDTRNMTPKELELQRTQLIYIAETQKMVLKYFNVYSFVLLPIYALIAFLVFGKRINFTEQLIINSYLQGFTLVITILFFLLGVFVADQIYLYATLFTAIYYSYAYSKLLEHKFGQALLYFLKFVLITIGAVIIFSLLGFLIGIIIAMSR